MNIKISVLPGASAETIVPLKQAVSKIPFELHTIFPVIFVQVLTRDVLDNRIAESTVPNIHTIKDVKRGWHIATMSTIHDASSGYQILVAVTTMLDAEREYFFKRNFLSSLMWCVWSEKTVVSAMKRAIQTTGYWKEKPETFIINELPAYFLRNRTWTHTGNEPEMERLYKHLIKELISTNGLCEPV